MSRSKRKPIVKDGQKDRTGDKKVKKRRAARAVRAEDEVADGSQYKKVSNSWDICDWKFFDPKNPKAERK